MKIERLKKVMVILKQMQNNTQYQRQRKLTQNHLYILGDNAIHLSKKNMRSCCQTFIFCIDKSLSKCLKFKPLHPYHWINFYAQIIEVFSISLLIIVYTLFSFFDFYDRNLFWYFNIYQSSVFVISTFLRLNTAFFNKGIESYNRVEIIRKYRQSLFIFDFIGYLSIGYQMYKQQDDLISKILCALFLIKYKVILSNIQNIEERLQLKGFQVHFWSLTKLLCLSIALCHIIGSFYYLLAIVERDIFNIENTWVNNLEIQNESVSVKYTESFYWALATIMLIGSKGETLYESIFCIITLFVTVGVFATILSSVQMIMEDLQSVSKFYKKDREIMNTFFSVHELPHSLKAQLHNFLKYSYEGHPQHIINTSFEKLMKKFPSDLQEYVKNERYNAQINKFTKLTQYFSQKTVKQIINVVQEEYYMPNQIIFEQGVYEPPMFYIILEGKVDIYYPQKSENNIKILQTLNPGDSFGHTSFFNNSVPIYNTRSSPNSFTTLLAISRAQFIEIVEQNNEDKEKFQMIHDDLIFFGRSKLLDIECYICKSQLHQENKCNLLQFQQNICNMKLRSFFSENRQVERNINYYKQYEYQRKKQKSLLLIDQIYIYQKKILENQFFAEEVQKYKGISIDEDIKQKKLEDEWRNQEQLILNQISSPSSSDDDDDQSQSSYEQNNLELMLQSNYDGQSQIKKLEPTIIMHLNNYKKQSIQKRQLKNEFINRNRFNYRKSQLKKLNTEGQQNIQNQIIQGKKNSQLQDWFFQNNKEKNQQKPKIFKRFNGVQSIQIENMFKNTRQNQNQQKIYVNQKEPFSKNKESIRLSQISEVSQNQDQKGESMYRQQTHRSDEISSDNSDHVKEIIIDKMKDIYQKKKIRAGGKIMKMQKIQGNLDFNNYFNYVKNQFYEENQTELQDLFTIINFDKLQQYEYYFPHNNCDNVILKHFLYKKKKKQNQKEELKKKNH